MAFCPKQSEQVHQQQQNNGSGASVLLINLIDNTQRQRPHERQLEEHEHIEQQDSMSRGRASLKPLHQR